MSDGIYAALSGAVSQQRALDAASNNVANTNTVGYRGDRVTFAQALARTNGGPAPDVLRFSEAATVQPLLEPGLIRETGNSLDLALQGEGLFVVDTPAGERYTRAGSFVTDGKGTLRTTDGFPVLGRDKRPIVLPMEMGPFNISKDGTISAHHETVGEIAVVRFDDPKSLIKEGSQLFIATGAPPEIDDSTAIMQGFLEGSNVHAITGMTEMIKISRSFDALERVIQTFRQIDERAVRDIARG